MRDGIIKHGQDLHVGLASRRGGAHHMSQPGTIRAVARGGDIRWSDRTRDRDQI